MEGSLIDFAMFSAKKESVINKADTVSLNFPGGIDMNRAQEEMEIRNSGGADNKFKIDAAMIEQYQNASGFVPVIIKMVPMVQYLAGTAR